MVTDCVSAIERDNTPFALGPRILCGYFYSNNLYTVQNSYKQVFNDSFSHTNADISDAATRVTQAAATHVTQAAGGRWTSNNM